MAVTSGSTDNSETSKKRSAVVPATQMWLLFWFWEFRGMIGPDDRVLGPISGNSSLTSIIYIIYQYPWTVSLLLHQQTIFLVVDTSPTLAVHSHQDDLSRSASGMKEARSPSGENEEEGPSDQIQISKELFLLVIQAGLLNNDGLGTWIEMKWAHFFWVEKKQIPTDSFRQSQTLRGPASTKADGWFRSSQRSCQSVRSLGCWQ